MFDECESLNELDLGMFDFINVINVDEIIGDTISLKKITFPNLPMEILLGDSWVDESGVTVTAARPNLGKKATYYRRFSYDDDKVLTTDQTNATIKAVGTIFTYSGARYKVTKASATGATVQYLTLIGKKVKTAKVPATIKIDGITYKVTSIAKNAFKNKKKLTKVTIEKNVTKIGNNAFDGCKKLKSIVIKSKKIKSVGKNAIKNIHKKANIDVPNSKKKAYKKLFKARTGFKKTMTIK